MYEINPSFLLYHDGERKFEMFCAKIGEIGLPSGHVVACDPFVGFEERVFLKKVTPGKYPVLLNIARYENDDERVAYAMIKFSDREVVSWEMALQGGQNIEELGKDEFFGYGVDSGTGCFLDKESFNSILAYEEEKQKDDPDYYIFHEVEDLLDESYKHTRNWVVTSIEGKADIAIFSTGWGDGYYPSFWGIDESGEPVCLVTDFLIME